MAFSAFAFPSSDGYPKPYPAFKNRDHCLRYIPMTSSDLPRAAHLLALIVSFASTPLMAMDLMDNGDLAPDRGVLSASSTSHLSDAKAAFVQQQGQGNLAELVQTGQALNAQVLQQGSDQEAFILQHGENLLAIIEQAGHGNFAEILQTGSDNQATISQYGAYNDARIEQAGSGQRSAVTQYGTGQQINIVQGR